MYSGRKSPFLIALVFASLVLAACSGVPGGNNSGSGSGSGAGSGSGSGSGSGAGGPYTIGGTVLGLSGSGLVLEDNRSDDLAISGTGTVSFTFKVAVSSGYNVIVKTQPTGQTCSVTNGGGTATANVTSVQVNCAPTFTIGGTVSGLLGSGLTLQDNGGDNLTVNGTGTVNFTFATPLLTGAAYAVTVLNQPTSPAQNCIVSNGSGTISGVVTNVQISCPQPKFSVGGNVSGLVVGPGDTMELQDNAGDNLFVTGDVPFTFPTQFSYGTTFSVTQFLGPTSQPQGCNIFNATGIVTGIVSNVLVDCQHNDWAWMFPASAPSLDTYGTAGLPSYTSGKPIAGPPFIDPNGNTPGSRDFAMAWTDNQGRRWLFGGYGFEVAHAGSDGMPGFLNDMWVWPTSPSSGKDDGWWTPGGWIPANLPIIVDNTGGPSYTADPKSLQFKNVAGNYGTAQGVGVSCASSAPCTVPGARWGGVTWTDASGNLWMFGGQSVDGILNDIWEFDITSGPCSYDLTTGTGIFTNCKWIWQGGSSAAVSPTTTTFPGGRWGAASYTDASGNLWMFGGQGYDSSGNIGLLNDLWKYNIATKTWTLILPSGVLSNQNGSYGTQGTGASGNVPGGRQTAVLWADGSGKIWLFGGFGLDSQGTSGAGQIGAVLNDLWKYDAATGFWTWVSGSNVANQNGIYNTQATSNATLNTSATSVPGARWGSAGWVTPDGGKLFLVGGFGYGSNSTQPTGFLNDVWEYDPGSNQWIWWKGSTDVNQTSTYITSPFNFFQLNYTNNSFGARRGAALWLPDPLGYVYMFGGEGYAATGGPYGHLNDVWRYLPFP